MRYVVASVDSSSQDVDIETVTPDPVNYIAQFEPEDVVNGKMVAWDEDGRAYSFMAEKLPSDNKPRQLFSVVDVGSWGAAGPRLVKIAERQTSPLRQLLVAFLQDTSNHSSKAKQLQQKSGNCDDYANPYSGWDIIQLVDEVSKLLNLAKT